MRQDSTPAPEGETPPCQCGHALNQHLLAGGHCEQRGCACRLFVIPLPPARERGEAMLAELRRKLLEEPTWPEDVPEVSGAECPDCGWPRVQAQREGYPLKAEVARLTRELAEARDTARKDNKRYEELLDRLDTERDRRITANQEADAARAEAARLREALEFYAHGLDGGRRARRALGQEGA